MYQIIVKRLLDHPNIVDPNVGSGVHNRTASMQVCVSLDVVLLLFDTEGIDKTPWVALLREAIRSHVYESAKLLLMRDDIDVNLLDSVGRTCLHNNTAIVQSLLSHPDTDPNAVDNTAASLPGLQLPPKSSLSYALQVLGKEKLKS
jgi:hypothetical protein